MVESNKVPAHIAIILDGNRRWAKKRGMPTLQGHTEGADNLERIARYCSKLGVKYLTVYAFSTENWKRTEDEVKYLMNLMAEYIGSFEVRFKDSNAVIRLVGNIDRLPKKLQDSIIKIEEKTKNNTGLILNLCINYGGREEIVNATKVIADKVASGDLKLDDINEDMFPNYLRTGNIPDPDLFIRAGGEKRLSGFLLWQSSYSELYFSDVLWPDFNENELDKAINEFNSRKRNFGK
jgi:undecaprenyl diphosphate synthase